MQGCDPKINDRSHLSRGTAHSGYRGVAQSHRVTPRRRADHRDDGPDSVTPTRYVHAMTWPLHTLQLHDAALDFANCRPTVTTWIAQMSDSIFGDKPARIHSIYGKDGLLGHLHDTVASSPDDLRAVLTQNHGGGVPIEVVDEIVAKAIQPRTEPAPSLVSPPQSATSTSAA